MTSRDFTSGALAGFLATAPMTLAMTAMHRQLPWWERYALPPRQITERVAEAAGIHDELSEPGRIAMTTVSHFAYGTAAGAAYVPLEQVLPGPPVVKGAMFGLAVWAISYQGWLPAVEILPPATEHPPRRNALMIAAHVVWGSALGVLFEGLAERGRPARANATHVDQDEDQEQTITTSL